MAKRVSDKRVLKLLRAFLNAGVMENGLVSPVDEGTPQGGALSPLLSNLVLDELDRELERRGHRFVRYADDCNIYVGSGLTSGQLQRANAEKRDKTNRRQLPILCPDPEVEPIGVFITGAFSGQFSLLFETMDRTIPTSAKFDFHNSPY